MGRVREALGIRLVDVGFTAAVAVAVELNVATGGGGAGAQPLNALAYVYGGILVLPVLFRRKWPLRALIGCSALLLIYYIVGIRRNISPAPLLSLPLYDAALAGYLALAIVIPAAFMTVGLIVVQATNHERLAQLASDFLPSVVVLALAVMLGDAVRSRRALAAETADKLRLADEERDAEAARQVAEERLRIARELHDTIAHSMATITVQAGSALHVLGDRQAAATPGTAATPGMPDTVATPGTVSTQAATDTVSPAGPAAAATIADTANGQRVHDALIAIRDTSKAALTDIRVTLGQLRADRADNAEARTGGLDRLEALSDAVRAAGAPVTVIIEGEQVPLPPGVDHAAYRILQESLTNVLRHAGPDASAMIRLSYGPDALTIKVTDDGTGSPSSDGTAGAGQSAGAGQAGNGATGDGHELTGDAHEATGDGHELTDGHGATGDGHELTDGHGLTGMTERAAAAGGELSAGPLPDGGFEVIARLPVTSAGAAR